MQGYSFANHYSLSGAEETGYDADCGEDEIEMPCLRGDEQEQAEQAADEVARYQCRLERPTVNEDSGENAEDSDGDLVGNLYACDLLGCAMKLISEQANYGEESYEVAKIGDDLGVPQAAHDGDTQDVAHGERCWASVSAGIRLCGCSAHGSVLTGFDGSDGMWMQKGLGYLAIQIFDEGYASPVAGRVRWRD
jgi:hypothetical protein